MAKNIVKRAIIEKHTRFRNKVKQNKKEASKRDDSVNVEPGSDYNQPQDAKKQQKKGKNKQKAVLANTDNNNVNDLKNE